MMFSRFILKPSNFRFAARICARDSNIISFNLLNNHDTMPGFFQQTPIFYSTNRNGNNNNGEDPSRLWNVSSEINEASNSLFDEESATPFDEFQDPKQMKSEQELHPGSLWKDEPLDTDFDDGGFFKEAEEKGASETTNEWDTAAGFKMWDLEVEEKKEMDSFFADVGEVDKDARLTLQGLTETDESKKIDEQKQLEVEEKVLDAVLKGPDRAFGDLLAASGITDEMLDSLIALKDLEGIQGLPPLHDIQDERYENSLRKSSRAEMERQKQEEVAKARVRQVDDKGRAYGTGRRKCSIARVWIQPGDGRFVVNDKEFDVYFPMLDHRATLLRPFTETVTLGKWDVNCTVKGGGVSGQVGAVRLGISRALQNWAPDLRPPLREAGFLTRDPRVVERKKPGKAKARKSFQWVKR